MQCDYLIVGAGFYGAVLAERIANDSGYEVILIDRRDHIGGNCYSYEDPETGIECHKYGTHIFHTSSKIVWNYLSNFMELNAYHHQVLTKYKYKVYQMPINLETINSFYNLDLNPQEAKDFIKKEIKKARIGIPKNLEEKAISLIGLPLYEAFIKGYTMKQWGRDPKNLPADIINRLPMRFDYKEDYFHDARWQGIPKSGYTNVFERMLNAPNLKIKLNCDYFEHKDQFEVKRKTIFTGPIDRYFDYQLGRLEWRAVEFKQEIVNVEDFQGTSVINYAESHVPYTRIHEYRHLHPERDYQKDKTIVFYETSKKDNDDPYYPINDESNQALFLKYKRLAKNNNNNVLFGGRLSDYAYYDMDKTVLAALKCYQNKIWQKN